MGEALILTVLLTLYTDHQQGSNQLMQTNQAQLLPDLWLIMKLHRHSGESKEAQLKIITKGNENAIEILVSTEAQGCA
jgi:hypothetical protein